jgi:hypothetical protein
MRCTQTDEVPQRAREIFVFQVEKLFTSQKRTLRFHRIRITQIVAESSALPVHLRELRAAMVHGTPGNKELVEDLVRPENPFVKWGRVGSGFAPDRIYSQVIGKLDQAVKKARTDATDTAMQLTDNMRMHRHKINDQPMTPCAATIGQADEVRARVPRGSGDQHESDLGTRVLPGRGP